MKKPYIGPVLLSSSPSDQGVVAPTSQNATHGEGGDPWEDDDDGFN